jgi:uncharacterized membrane-anchored protein YjiN (DUF445 family)
MRALATGLLVLMALVFLAACRAPPAWAWAPYVRAFAEAALVGGCADWFAVTALFRRPLGLPIPHTAIIPRSKARIGEALGRFIVDNFLSPRVLDARLRQWELAAWGGAWLERPENARRLAGRILALGPDVVRLLPAREMEDLARAVALAVARSVPAAPTAGKLLATLWNEGRVEPLVERVTTLLADWIAGHEDLIFETVRAQSWRWAPGWLDRAITRKITGGVLNILTEMRQPDHPWRASLAAAVEDLTARLAEDPNLRARGEALKAQVLDDPRVADFIHTLWSRMRRQWESDWADGSGAATAVLAPLISGFGGWLRTDPVMRRTLDTTARALVRGLIAPRRHQIGGFVAQVVAGWDTRGIVDRLELQVGPDLQYIRVNGTIVGGLVGLALFAVSRILGV